MQFSESQIKAIEHVDGPCLVLAVPGAGKTTILIQRIINLVKVHGVLPSQILALTFTRASANDMKERIEELGDDIKVQNIKTIHSLCYDIVSHVSKGKETFQNDRRQAPRKSKIRHFKSHEDAT